MIVPYLLNLVKENIKNHAVMKDVMKAGYDVMNAMNNDKGGI